jgi:uncharacterized membrane protein YgaE (UPF0421/DUF939 family)
LTIFQNVYIYDSRTLWIAYGLAITFTLIAVCIGLTAILLNNASYNNNFSTVLRISRSSKMSTEVQELESDGSEPLSKHLAQAKLLIGRDGELLSEKGSYTSSVTVTEEPPSAASSSLLRSNTRNTM